MAKTADIVETNTIVITASAESASALRNPLKALEAPDPSVYFSSQTSAATETPAVKVTRAATICVSSMILRFRSKAIETAAQNGASSRTISISPSAFRVGQHQSNRNSL